MEWGILVLTILFVIIGYIVLQGTRASLAWRRAAEKGDVDVIRRMLEETMASWRSMKRPKEAPPDVWRGVGTVELMDVGPDSARVSLQVESEYRQMGGRWVEISNPLQQGMAVSAKAIDMLLYDVPNLRLASVRTDVYTTFRDPDGTAERACILTTYATREIARTVDWDEWPAETIIDAFDARYRMGERGVPLPIDPDEGLETPATGGAGGPRPSGQAGA